MENDFIWNSIWTDNTKTSFTVKNNSNEVNTFSRGTWLILPGRDDKVMIDNIIQPYYSESEKNYLLTTYKYNKQNIDNIRQEFLKRKYTETHIQNPYTSKDAYEFNKMHKKIEDSYMTEESSEESSIESEKHSIINLSDKSESEEETVVNETDMKSID